MPPSRSLQAVDTSGTRAPAPLLVQERPLVPQADPTGQSPDAPIEFSTDTEVGRGNAERANAEPEPAALHAAEVPGKPDTAQRRREVSKHHDN